MCTVTRLAAAAERLAICEGNLGRAHAEDRVADRVTLRLVEAALANERSRFNGLTDIFEAFVGALKTRNGGTDDQQFFRRRLLARTGRRHQCHRHRPGRTAPGPGYRTGTLLPQAPLPYLLRRAAL